MTTWSRRCRALLLTLLFLGGGTSLPSLDVLLFHSADQTQTSAHFESANGCASHTGHCSIGCPASAAGALGARTAAPLRECSAQIVRLKSIDQLPLPRLRGSGFLSRAPPSLHV